MLILVTPEVASHDSNPKIVGKNTILPPSQIQIGMRNHPNQFWGFYLPKDKTPKPTLDESGHEESGLSGA